MTKSSAKKRITIGIVGCGRFGALWAARLSELADVLVYDARFGRAEHLTREIDVRPVPIEQVATAEVVFVIVPITEFEQVCKELQPHVRPDTVIIDMCAVKTYPIKVMRSVFSKSQPTIGAHPLFGPDSVARLGLVGRKIVICNGHAEAGVYKKIVTLFQKLGLRVVEATARDHDQAMAHSHALVHFIGRGLAALNLKEADMVTADYETLLRMQSMVVNDTWQLFHDMQTYNPYAKSQRRAFMRALEKVEHALAERPAMPTKRRKKLD